MTDGKNDDFDCNICLDTAKDCVISLCGHLFCWRCLHQWLEMRANQTCPVCKSDISRDKVIPLYGRGSSNHQDPRDKQYPPRPSGVRTEQQQHNNSTNAGTVLIAVNPYKNIDIYNEEWIRRFRDSVPHEPHIFAVAERTRHTHTNQSVIVSGESGSGKTESTKRILQFLCLSGVLEFQILESIGVLESFGNAKTHTNDNSSRFGKFLKLFRTRSGAICGCRIQSFLLELSRVTNQDTHNYHVFYQLASDEQFRRKYQLEEEPIVTYHRSCDSLRFSCALLDVPFDGVSGICAVILHLRRLQFAAADADGAESRLSTRDEQTVSLLSTLLQVSPFRLTLLLLNRHISVSGTEMQIPLSIVAARDNCQSLAKALYLRLFQWLLRHMNAVMMHAHAEAESFFGVLDIFGFENFETNSFEQMCINYANEKLHKFFNTYIYNVHRQMYESEGVDYGHVSFADNSACCELLEKSPKSIIHILSEECRMPRATDTTFVDKLHAEFHAHAHYMKGDDRRFWNNRFGVRHYAGSVLYDCSGFLAKNKHIHQQQQLFQVMAESGDAFVQQLAECHEEEHVENARTTMTMTKLRSTVCDSFRADLTALIGALEGTEPAFVRCIKPNKSKQSNRYDSDFVAVQLKYLGMNELIRMRSQKYPIHMPIGEFQCRYSRNIDTIDHRQLTIGRTKIFMHQSLYDTLEYEYRQRRNDSAVLLQRQWRRHVQRQWYCLARAATRTIQMSFRAHRQRLQYKRLRRATITIQSYVRGMFAREVAASMRHARRIQFSNDDDDDARDELKRIVEIFAENRNETETFDFVKTHDEDDDDDDDTDVDEDDDDVIGDDSSCRFSETNPLLEYAKRHFNSHQRCQVTSLQRKNDFLSPHEMVTWTPMHTIPMAHMRMHRPENDSRACQVFREVNAYLGTDSAETIRAIVACGLNGDAQLKDEILCQLMRQSSENPSKVETERALQLLTLLCASFVPSRDLSPVLVQFLRQIDDRYGRLALLLLPKHASRQFVPSFVEIRSIKTLSPLFCRFHFYDGRTVTIDVRANETADDVIRRLANRIGLRSVEGWALYVDDRRPIGAFQFIADCLSRLEASDSWRFVFRKRLFLRPSEISHDPMEVHLLYSQALQRVTVQDAIPVSERIALQLSGLTAQIVLGETDDFRPENYQNIDQYLSRRIIRANPKAQWSQRIADAHAQYGKGKAPIVAKVWFLSVVMQYPMYGMELFPVTRKGHETKLGVACGGVSIVSSANQVLESFPYAEIDHWSLIPPNQLQFKHQQKFHTFESSACNDIVALIAAYSPKTRLTTAPQQQWRRSSRVTRIHDTSHYDLINCRRQLIESQLLRKPHHLWRRTRYTHTYWAFSKTLIVQSLLLISDSELNQLAVRAFRLLMTYAGLVNDTPTDDIRLIQTLVSMTSLHESDILRNELFLQLIKQTTDVPFDSTRFWHVMAVHCSLTFPTERRILYYLCTHLRRHADNRYARFSLHQLQGSLETRHRPRRRCPSPLEIRATVQCRRCYTQIRFLDGQYQAIEFDACALIGEVIEQIRRKLTLSIGGYALYDERDRPLNPQGKVCDSIGEFFVFKKHLFCDLNLNDPIERELLFHQFRDRITRKQFPLTDDERQTIDALTAQIIARGAGDARAETETFFATIQSFQLYRSTIFSIVQTYTSQWNRHLWLAIDANGFHLLKHNSRTILVTCLYQSIVDYCVPSSDSLLIVAFVNGQQMKYVFITQQCNEIVQLMRDYTTTVNSGRRKSVEFDLKRK